MRMICLMKILLLLFCMLILLKKFNNGYNPIAIQKHAFYFHSNSTFTPAKDLTHSPVRTLVAETTTQGATCPSAVVTSHMPVLLGTIWVFSIQPKDTSTCRQESNLQPTNHWTTTWQCELQPPHHLINGSTSPPALNLKQEMQEAQSKVLLLIQSLFRFSVHESA